MTWADYTILGIIFLSALIGLVRGFLREVVSLLVWMLGFWLALRFAGPVGDGLSFIKDPTWRLVAGFVVLFVLILAVGTLVGFFMGKLVESTDSGTGDRILGVLFGVTRGVVIVTALVVLGSLTLMPRHSWWRESRLIPYAMPLVRLAERLAPHDFDPADALRAGTT